ncbi:unannotated protein [freshwater metagenome]|uniref:Unannotated protein n=1 Tax=freshwater metagenome TaxID=449393 RepID=A0A6J6K306_9ZZZZ
MCLIEGIVGEGNQHFPQGTHRVIRKTVAVHSSPERLKLDVEFFLLLLTHRAPEQVGLSERVSS